MRVIYIAGPFRAPTPWQVEQNVRRAEEAALEVWKLGAAVLCPHTNTRYFSGEAADSLWLDGTMELLRRCDAVMVLPGYDRSAGTKAEVVEAERLHMPVFGNLAALERWLLT